MNYRSLSTLLAMSMLVLAACSTNTPGTAQPRNEDNDVSLSDSRSANPSTHGSNLPVAGAPDVTNPLTGIKNYKHDPCSMLTSQQLTTLGLPDKGDSRDGAFGPVCYWEDNNSTAQVRIQWNLESGAGISAIYRGRDDYKIFEPMQDVQGFPVVHTGTPVDQKFDLCSIVVGTSNRVAFRLGVGLSDGNSADPCRMARRVAKMMIMTMKKGR